MNKYSKQKILSILICVIFIIVTIMNIIIAINIFHTLNCDIHNCTECSIINNAQEFINFIILGIAILNATIPLICIVFQKLKLRKRETLVSQSIIMNE